MSIFQPHLVLYSFVSRPFFANSLVTRLCDLGWPGLRRFLRHIWSGGSSWDYYVPERTFLTHSTSRSLWCGLPDGISERCVTMFLPRYRPKKWCPSLGALLSQPVSSVLRHVSIVASWALSHYSSLRNFKMCPIVLLGKNTDRVCRFARSLFSAIN